MVDWSYFDRSDELTKKYLPAEGQGDTMATQIVTAVCKLVYKYYNDGDVYDNTGYLAGWANDLSDYANWLVNNAGAGFILERIFDVMTEDEYTEILKDLANYLICENKLAEYNKKPAVGSIYDSIGDFHFYEFGEDEEEEE